MQSEISFSHVPWYLGVGILSPSYTLRYKSKIQMEYPYIPRCYPLSVYALIAPCRETLSSWPSRLEIKLRRDVVQLAVDIRAVRLESLIHSLFAQLLLALAEGQTGYDPPYDLDEELPQSEAPGC